MWRRRLFAGVGMAVVIVASACQWIVGIGDPHLGDGGQGDGGVDPCASPNVPANPGQGTSSPGDTGMFTMALWQILLGQTDGGPYYGFNLDGTCTCPEPSSCIPADAEPCDDEGGVDNYARRIFEVVNGYAVDFGQDSGFITEDKLNMALHTGLSGALIQVSSYNGKKDDGEVTVTVYGSVGFDGYDAGKAPAFDGGDHWLVDPASAKMTYQTSNAYVADYTLVATMDFPIIVGSAFTQPVYIQLHAGYIAAKLTVDGTGNVTQLSGMLGGRWDPKDFLPSLQVVPDPVLSGSYLCGNDVVYQTLKGVICSHVDVNIDPTLQGGLCNAVSMGLGFVATPAYVGNTVTPPDGGFPCGMTWTDKCN